MRGGGGRTGGFFSSLTGAACDGGWGWGAGWSGSGSESGCGCVSCGTCDCDCDCGCCGWAGWAPDGGGRGRSGGSYLREREGWDSGVFV